MSALFDDRLYSDTAQIGAGESGIMAAPPVADAGVGLAPPQAPAMAPFAAPPAAPQGRPLDERIAYGLEAFGAGMKGQPSLLERGQKQAREDKLLKVKELAAHVDAIESGSKIAKTLQGKAKENFVRDYSAQLDQMRPGLGGTFAHIAENPDTLDMVQEYMPYLPEGAKLLLKKNPDAFWKYASSEGGQKDIENAKNQFYGRVAAQKADIVIGKVDQLGVAPELAQALKTEKTASAFKRVQDALPEGHKAKLTEKQWAAINSTPHNQELFYNSLGIMSPKDEAAAALEAKKGAAQPGMKAGHTFSAPAGDRSVVTLGFDPKKTIWPNAKRDPNGFAILGEGEKDRPPNVTVEAAVQTHTDANNQLWERKRGGNWELAKGPDGKLISGHNKEAADKPYQDTDKARAQYNLDYPISMAGMRTPKGNKPVPDFNSYYQNEWQKTKQVTGIDDTGATPAKPAAAAKPAAKATTLYTGKTPPAEYPDAKWDERRKAWIVVQKGKTFAVAE